jgi:type II secretory pathway component PulF
MLGTRHRMADSQSATIQLQDVLSFNEQLIAISRSGIRLAYIPNPHQIERTLQDWSGRIAMQVGRGLAVEPALDSTGVSDEYRVALKSYVALGGSIEAAQGLVDGGSWSDRNRNRFSLSLLGTWIVWMLACIAWLALIGIITPPLRSLYEVSRVPPGPAFAWLHFFYSHWWQWMIGLVALTILVPLISRMILQRTNWSWLPLRRRVLSRLKSSSQMQIESLLAKQQHAEISTLQTFDALANALKLKAQRDGAGLQAWIPSLIAAFLGGLIVLAVGMIVFWPLLEYLFAICQPPEVYRVRK